MWDGLIVCLNRFLRLDAEALASSDGCEVWSDFICDQWPRSRVRVNGLNFHQLPHPGSVSLDKPKIEEKLVDI